MSEKEDNLSKNEKTILKGLDISSQRFDGQALFPEDLTVVGKDPGTGPGDYLFDIRATYDRIVPETVQSMVDVGVILPVIVVRDGDRILVADGIGRTLNARAANDRLKKEGREARRMKCLFVQKGTSRLDIDVLKMAANVHRLEENPLDVADKIFQFIRDHGEDSLPKMLTSAKMTKQRAEELLSLRGAAPEVRKALSEKQYGVEAAISFASLSSVKEQTEVAEEAVAIAAAIGKDKPSADLAREITKRHKDRKASGGTATSAGDAAVSKTMARLMYRYAETYGWPENPNGVSLLGAFIGEAPLSDVNGGEALLKNATQWAKDKKNGKEKPPTKKAAAKKATTKKGKK